MKAKSKKAFLAAISVALIGVMGAAGTFAYLQDSTDDVVNTFKTNKVTVELAEKSGNDYNIIPGTSETKDPKVTVDNTVDSYVFVKVVDSSDGIIQYEIDDGWTPLDGYSGVYYREVEKDADPKEFSVLAGDKVSYPSSLTNDNMVDDDGSLKENVELTFTAYAIQKVNGTDENGTNTEFEPEDAWLQIPVVIEVGADDFVTAVEKAYANEVVTLTSDVTIDRAIPQSESGSTNIDLNGKTLTCNSTSSTDVTDGKTLTFENGTIEYPNMVFANAAIGVQKGAVVTLKDVEMETGGAALYPRGDAAEVNVIDSTITSKDSYCVATNAATLENYNVKINLKGSALNGPTPVMINIPGELSMKNCTVKADMQGVVVRGGTAVIEDCEIENTSNDDWAVGYFNDKNWGSGNTLPLAGITIGNKSTAYQYPSNVTLKNTTVTSTIYPTVYIYGNATETNGAFLTYDGASAVGEVTYGGGYAKVNGEVQQ